MQLYTVSFVLILLSVVTLFVWDLHKILYGLSRYAPHWSKTKDLNHRQYCAFSFTGKIVLNSLSFVEIRNWIPRWKFLKEVEQRLPDTDPRWSKSSFVNRVGTTLNILYKFFNNPASIFYWEADKICCSKILHIILWISLWNNSWNTFGNLMPTFLEVYKRIHLLNINSAKINFSPPQKIQYLMLSMRHVEDFFHWSNQSSTLQIWVQVTLIGRRFPPD